ncbi:MAG: HAD-IA family hydrolase [Candidatus Brocadiae bacterium]|nr:HAD-IA family hydrolase [Candidatus Brocadiia bacterium]
MGTKENIQIQAIFFDLDDTLCATSDFSTQARFDALKAMINIGLKMDIEVLNTELKELIEEFTSNYPHHFDKLLLRIPESSYRGINKAVLVAAAVAAYHDAKHNYLKPYPDVLHFLQYIANIPILKGVITDGLEIKQAEKLIRLGIYPYFHPQAIFISDQIGFSKINSKTYIHICSSLGLSPHRTMYVGDHPMKDIDSANKAGLISVRIRREGKYKTLEGKTKACHEIQNLQELLQILEERYLGKEKNECLNI